MVDAQHDHARTMGAIATVISAFVVFVLGGGAVLVSWVSAQEAAVQSLGVDEASSIELPPASVEVVETLAAPEVPEPVKTDAIDAVDAPEPVVAPTRRRTARRATPPPPVEPEVVEEVVPVAVAPEPVDPNAKGNVHIIGDAERVRLIGSRGPFTAGVVPAGTYTIQATFEDDEPRMAGTVVVGDSERVKVLCRADLRQCSRL